MSVLRLIRHGQASYGAADYDVLSPLGITQAQALGRAWVEGPTPDAIYVGPMRRQRDTAEHARAAAAAAGREMPAVVVLDELAEYPAFELVARCLPQVARADAELAAVLTGGGDPSLADRALWATIDRWTEGTLDTGDLETFADFVARVGRGLDRIFAAHPGRSQTVVAVTSGGPIGVTARLALGLAPRATLAMWRVVRNASTSEFRWRSRGERRELSLFGWNHVEYLPADQRTLR